MTTTTAKRATKKPPTIGALIDQAWELREKKRALDAQIKIIETEAAALESTVMERLQEEGLDSAKGTRASISLSTSTVANVEDWDALFAFIKKGNHFHLLQRRVSDPAFREFLEQGRVVPGAQPFTKTKALLRTL